VEKGHGERKQVTRPAPRAKGQKKVETYNSKTKKAATKKVPFGKNRDGAERQRNAHEEGGGSRKRRLGQ